MFAAVAVACYNCGENERHCSTLRMCALLEKKES